jgi:Mg2+-importing ATPase
MLPAPSRAHPVLTATSLAVVAIAVVLPFTPIGTYFGFVPPPARFYFILGAMVLVYLYVVELAKRGFYRWSEAGRRPRRSGARV